MAEMEKLRDDEKFVIAAVAKKFSGTWRPGEDPPDAYLTFAGNTVAVEISTLTQYVTDDRGTRPRVSDDAAISDIVGSLNSQLTGLIPNGYSIGLTFTTPISKVRKTTDALSVHLKILISGITSDLSESEAEICGNLIKIRCHKDEFSLRSTRIWAIAHRRLSNPHILTNAIHILEERIATKTKKCAQLDKKQPIWLAFINDYWLADAGIYRQALGSISKNFLFENILVVRGDGSVEVIWNALD